VPRNIIKKEKQEILMRIQDRLNKLRNKRGFTLVELMIVVAIIGVLAALAIYGVRKYLTNAKTAEARMSLGRLAKDAALAYEKENVTAGIIALQDTAAIAHSICPSATPVPAAAADISNQKYQSSPADWKGTWECLKFSMNDPQYFQYDYQAQGTLNPAVDGDAFTAIAHGDLDGDGNLSDFFLPGAIQTASNELVLTLAASITESAAEE
jgi:type IV pilus assembly protein PilA